MIWKAYRVFRHTWLVQEGEESLGRAIHELMQGKQRDKKHGKTHETKALGYPGWS
jgi:hypothetical protein